MVFTAYNKQYERIELVKAIPNITDRAIAESVVQRFKDCSSPFIAKCYNSGWSNNTLLVGILPQLMTLDCDGVLPVRIPCRLSPRGKAVE